MQQWGGVSADLDAHSKSIILPLSSLHILPSLKPKKILRGLSLMRHVERERERWGQILYFLFLFISIKIILVDNQYSTIKSHRLSSFSLILCSLQSLISHYIFHNRSIMSQKIVRLNTKSTSTNSCDSENELRRGPWTLEEDNLLIHYITSHGEGRWNSLARYAGTPSISHTHTFMCV